MNVRYNPTAGRFESEFSTDFQGDYAAVKAAGFRYDGLSKLWWTAKLPALNKLRENKPASGLTISEDAYQTYVRLSEIEAKNAEVRAQFAPMAEEIKKEKKNRKKKELEQKTYHPVVIPPKPHLSFDRIDKEDLPPMPVRPDAYVPPVHLGPNCHICNAPVYFYELQNPPTCLFCETQK